MSFLKSVFNSEKKEQLNKGLSTTKKSFFSKLGKAVAGKSTIDADLLDELEEVFIRSDVGVDTTLKIIDALEAAEEKAAKAATPVEEAAPAEEAAAEE